MNNIIYKKYQLVEDSNLSIIRISTNFYRKWNLATIAKVLT